MIEEEKYLLGHYIITYTDGTQKQVELKYGHDISNRKIPYSIFHSELLEMIGRTRPVESDGMLYYRWRISNPCPDKTVQNVVFQCAEGKKAQVFLKQLQVVSRLV